MEQVGLAEEARLIFLTHVAREGDLLATIDDAAPAPGGGPGERGACASSATDGRRATPREWAPVSGGWRGVMEEYRALLPDQRARRPWSPCSRAAPRCSPRRACPSGSGAEVWLKVEGANPTGSFKDRGMTMAISKAVEERGQGGGVRVDGQHLGVGGRLRVAGGPRLRRAHPRGAHRARQAGPGPDARRTRAPGARELRPAAHHRARPAQPRAHHRGQLGQPGPDRGAEDRRLRDRRRPRRRPGRALHPGGQRREYFGLLAGLSTVQGGRARRRSCPACSASRPPGRHPSCSGHPVEEPETVATAIRIGNPASWYSATAAASESGGSITAVTDDEILEAYTFLAQQESVFCEAASSASVAGSHQARRARRGRPLSAC